ncbi:MAG: GTPase [Psychroserpens sp.]|uniref:GTPase n=1 Tax=Psychroserpens sp. TaxID=2020870 RepID=UPI0030017566
MTLLFVYNANSGALNALFDVGHKLFSPSTYQCNLCDLTYDTFKENKIWKAYRKESSIAMEFYHKDEFKVKYPDENMSFPSILKLENNSLTLLFDDTTLNKIASIEALITLLKTTL